MDNSISDLLEQLQKISEDDQKGLAQWCQELCDFYEQHERHSYSEITKYITSLDGGLEYMERIIPILGQAKIRMADQRPQIGRMIEKLIDHIQLETVRMRYINRLTNDTFMQKYLEMTNQQIEGIETLEIRLRENADELEKRTKELQSEIKANEKIRSELKGIMKTAKKAANKVKKAESHSITILGIFASITLAFIGGLTFSTSVLQNISNASIYKILLVSCGIAAVIINIIYLLLRFIKEINSLSDTKEHYPEYLKKAMAIIAVIVLLDIAAWFFDFKYIAEMCRNFIFHK